VRVGCAKRTEEKNMAVVIVAFRNFANVPKKEFSVGYIGRPSGFITNCHIKDKKVKQHPITGLEWPTGFQEVKVPRFHDNGTGWW
jgi:hypothetical protein